MKVVLDTNVIIAAFAARGLCADVFEVCLADHQILISSYILDEVHEKLLSKLKLTAERASEMQTFLGSFTTVVTPVEVAADVCRDKDDLPVIGTALAAAAPILVSGDKDLLSLGTVQGISILSPRQFWEMLHETGNGKQGTGNR